MSTKIEKHKICASCLSIGITDPNCVCAYQNNYDTVELEFAICTCCDSVINDGRPLETDFNKSQYEKLERESKK